VGAATEPRCKELSNFGDQDAIAPGVPHDVESSDVHCGTLPRCQGGDLRVETSQAGADILKPVPDLRHDGFACRSAHQDHVDRARPQVARIERELREAPPPALSRDPDLCVLSFQMLGVPWSIRTRRALEKPDKLITDGGRNDCPRLEAGAGALASFEMADVRLRKSGPDSHLRLREARARAGFTER
jgi:hypothetical protein